MQQIDTPEVVTCPWCEAPFEVIATSSASCFKCPACGNESSLGSLRNPDLRPNALAISESASKGTAEHLSRHSLAYAYIDKDSGAEAIASGTVVQLGKRLLLATVKHANPKDVGSIELVKKSSLITPERFTCVTRRVRHPSVDVAAFELDSDSVSRVGAEPISVHRIHDGGTGTSLKAYLVGYPSDFVVRDRPFRGVTGFYSLSYGCEPIEPARWSAITRQSGTFDPDIHVVTEFNADVVDHTPSLPVPRGLPAPFGMSGGGLWQRAEKIKDNEIWTPDGLRIIAIQSSILNEKPYLKAIQIVHWLKLIADEYPELQTELVSRFPRIATL